MTGPRRPSPVPADRPRRRLCPRAGWALAALALAAPVAAQDRRPPYWASIAAGKALMRTGPDRSYPAVWLYTRRDLPVRVLQVEGAWRRVQEADGTAGWMQAILLAARRTVIVTGGFQAIRADRGDDAPLLAQAANGVIGRISKCDGRWCRITVAGRDGYVAQTGLYGVAAGEVVE